MKKIILSGLFILGFLSFNAFAGEKKIGTWATYGLQPWRYEFPVKMIVKDLADLGVNEIYFFEQFNRGGPFLHRTNVKSASTLSGMGERDFLKELLEETGKYNIKVWLTWTTPIKNYTYASMPGYKDAIYGLGDIGLNSRQLKRVYRDEIEEIAKNYLSKYKNIEGIFWHELDCSESEDDHQDDLVEFKDFCKRNFNEEYPGTSIPKTNPEDKWWRRFYLYKNEVMNSFVKEMAESAKKYNLKTGFVFYKPEAGAEESWKWGYDAVGLEKICDMMWFSGYDLENGKFYQSFKGSMLDFGPGYRSQNLPRNYSYAFHGYPLSYFDAFGPVYIKDMRAYYSSIESFTKKYGDFYNGFMGYNEKELSLFYGKENLGNWLKLMSSWQGGETPSVVSVAINPVSFGMLYPFAPGNEHKKNVQSLMESLTHYLDIDGMVTGSLKMKENLNRYSLIIIPQDMATGLDERSYLLYLSYVERGGKLLIINTPVSTGREDLTNLSDKTEQICGIKLRGKNLPGYLSLKSNLSSLSLPEKKFWGETSKIEVKKAEVLVKDKYTDVPLLTGYRLGKGEVLFSAIGFNPEITAYFASIVESVISLPISLEKSKGMRILETTKKDNSLCISLFEKGSALLKVNTELIGLKGKVFQLKDIVTGSVIKEKISPSSLLEGIPVEIKYLNQPFILALEKEEDIKEYHGIYPSQEVFKGMKEQRVIENPEVPILVPSGKGIRVGVYHGGYGAESIIKALKKEGFRVFSLPRIETEALGYADVVIIPQCTGVIFFNQAIEDIRKYVNEGGGVLFTHDAVGYRRHKTAFPEIGKGITNPKLDIVKVIKEHPITTGLKKEETFIHAYADHIAIEKGGEAEVLIEDEKGNAVVVAGRLGKGKVVLNGMITGYASIIKGGYDGEEKEPEGGELKVLINAVKWLGEK